MSQNPYVIDVSVQTFAREVMQRSLQVPVLVDFWAAWCAPCKTLTPLLEKIALAYQGQVIIAKVNTDVERDIAAHFGIRSLPTLKLFHQGQPVEELVGMQSEKVIRELIDRYRVNPMDSIREQVALACAQGQPDYAIQLLQEALQLEPDNYVLYQDIASILIDQNKIAEAQELLKSLPAAAQADAGVTQLLARIEFAELAASAPPIQTLGMRVSQNADDAEARYQLAVRLIVVGDFEQGMEHLLELFRRNRAYEDDLARKTLVSVFNMLGNKGGLVARYRAKLSSLLF